jgi:hypothetical protein
MGNNVFKLFLVGPVVMLATATGCGKSESPSAGTSPAAQSASHAAVKKQESIDISKATETVSRFLDAIRRGGDTGGAHALLTKDACSVLEGLGRTVQPIGSPSATFTVTRSEAIEDHPNMALVHSTWAEPGTQTVQGATPDESYQVVWALQWEQGAWKISGLAMELDPEQPPMIVDFEDHVQMANLFRSEADSSSSDNGIAAQPGRTDELSQAPAAAGKF